MSIVVDANILLFVADPLSPFHQDAKNSVQWLLAKGELAYILPQSIYEFWVVATRPTANRGLGLTPSQAQIELVNLKSLFRFLPDIPAICPEWEKLVVQHNVAGKTAHDARYAAAMSVHGVIHLLTFNGADFKRYPHLTIIEPSTVMPPPTLQS